MVGAIRGCRIARRTKEAEKEIEEREEGEKMERRRREERRIELSMLGLHRVNFGLSRIELNGFACI